MSEQKDITASILIIGNEILSGMVDDQNIQFIASRLIHMGIELKEVRIIPDIEDDIVQNVNYLRKKYDYVFTTGGIGPTHDDITTSSIASAFGVTLYLEPNSYKEISRYYEDVGLDLNEARKKMAIIPEGSTLISNDISKAPGFFLENVFVMAGIPHIMQNMFLDVEKRLIKSSPILIKSYNVEAGESMIAEILTNLQNQYPEVEIGSYPFKVDGQYHTNIVFKSKDTINLHKSMGEFALFMSEMKIKYRIKQDQS
ncbi:MAG: molybdopterin-binding protein [Rickettsiaceae bacterium]|nr:molybdopterin-binding protein [Rickettsiaceae bacterium]